MNHIHMTYLKILMNISKYYPTCVFLYEDIDYYLSKHLFSYH